MNTRLGLSDSLSRALHVIQGVFIPEAVADEGYVTVEPYANGLEQGFCVRVLPRHTTGLNSMLAVVYVGPDDGIKLCWGPAWDFYDAEGHPIFLDCYPREKSYSSLSTASEVLKKLILAYYETGEIPADITG